MTGANYMFGLLLAVVFIFVVLPMLLRFLSRFNLSEMSFKSIFRGVLTLFCLVIIVVVVVKVLG